MTKHLLLTADNVITMDGANRVISDGGVFVRGNRIAAVGDSATLERSNPSAEVRRLKDRLLMPGFVNAYCHSGVLRGTAEGLPVWDWLRM